MASLALAELELFRRVARLDDEVVLVDEATGRVLMTYVAAHEGVMMLGPGYRAGVDPDGFFVLDPAVDPPTTLFRARRFSQQPLPTGEVEFAGGGPTARVSMSPVGEHDPVPPQWLAVRSRARTPGYFDYISIAPVRPAGSTTTRSPARPASPDRGSTPRATFASKSTGCVHATRRDPQPSRCPTARKPQTPRCYVGCRPPPNASTGSRTTTNSSARLSPGR